MSGTFTIGILKRHSEIGGHIVNIQQGRQFVITGLLGILCAKKRTAYLIMCFTAFTVVSILTAVVSIQLLRLGLVNHTADGHTFQKEDLDILIIIALATAGTECLLSLISTFFSCRLAKAAKKELFKQRDGMFHVKVLGQKDIVVITKPLMAKNNLTKL